METDADRFSQLPYDLIIAIISFLPFLDSYRLCTSRKEWHKNALWLHCPSFELSEINFMFPDARQYWLSMGKRVQSMELKRTGKIRYVHFFNRTVNTLASPFLSKFSFRFHYSSDQYHANIDKWLKVALSKNVKELRIDFSDGDPIEPQPMLHTPQYVLPIFLYQAGMSIRVLSINSCGLGYCNFQSFIGLTTLSLTRVRISWREIEHIILSCPYLECLSLVECYRLIKVNISIMLLRLKKLIVRHCEPLTIGIELCLPTLEYFEYAGRMVPFRLRQLVALNEVLLDYHMATYYPLDAGDVKALFSGFADAKILKVATSALKIFPSVYLSNGQPLFPILGIKHLTLKTGMEQYEVPTIMCLLRSSPYLKTLTISTGFMRAMHFQEFKRGGHGYLGLPQGLWTADGWTLDYLECVLITDFTGKRAEINLLKFILKNSMCLQKLIIKQLIRGTSSVASEAFVEIQDVAIASGNAVIKWY